MTRVVVEHTDLPSADGAPMRLHIARPAGDCRGGVVVAHELFGVNDDIRGVLELLANDGWLAVAPEFFHRTAPPGSSLAKDDTGRAQGFAWLHEVTYQHVVDDVAAVRGWLRDELGESVRVGVLGFSVGGHFAWLAASAVDLACVAVVYGGWLTTDDPPLQSPSPAIGRAPDITARVLYAVGADDRLIAAHERAAVTAALIEARTPHDMVVYEGVGHAFFWESSPTFDRVARDDTWERIRTMLDDELSVSAH